MAAVTFDPQFIFGGASAAGHVEGGLHDDFTDWLTCNAVRLACEAPYKNYGQGTVPNLPREATDPASYLPGRSANHYYLFPEDLNLAASLGLTGFRFSVEWSRIQPDSPRSFNASEFIHYNDVVRVADFLGIKALPILNHFRLPRWARDLGGWHSDEVVDAFGHYAERVAIELRSASHIGTINEPETYAMMTSAPSWVVPPSASWLDYPKSTKAYLHMRCQLVKAHQAAYSGIKRHRKDVQVGITLNHVFYDGAPNPLAATARRIGKHFTNNYFLDRVADNCDWVGLQYYFHCRINGIRPFANRFKRRSDMGWELYPCGIEPLLLDMSRYGKPIYVTESGLADTEDKYRAWYIESTLRHIAKAIERGADCRAYFYFSLTDGEEWDKGSSVHTGLANVHYETLERIVRPSAYRYAEIIAHRAL